jgi:ribosomal protein S18 acetylase RimI-like enzyme
VAFHALRPPPSPSRVTVRQATHDDLAVVVRLRIALLREHAANPVYAQLRRDAEERARALFAAQLRSADEAIFLAERGGVPVGVLRCVDTLGSPLLQPARYGYVSSVYVLPEARRIGVLTALLRAGVRWCEARGLTEMRLHNAADNDTANAAWEALGFQTVEVLRVRQLGSPDGAVGGAAGAAAAGRDAGRREAERR